HHTPAAASALRVGAWFSPAFPPLAFHAAWSQFAPMQFDQRSWETTMRIDLRLILSICMAAIINVFAIASHADETCNSPYMSGLIKRQEDFVHVWTLGVPGMGDGSDKLVTIDANPASKTYGKVIDKISVGGRGQAPHM